MRFPPDWMLERLTALPVASWRLWAARKAADRALHVPALRAAADDPYVLARLGLYPDALSHSAADDAARFGRLLAKTALGKLGALQDAGTLDSAKRAMLARALAPHSASAAARLLGEEHALARAACLLAAGSVRDASVLVEGHEGREAEAICAALHVAKGSYAAARAAINAMFGHDGLSPPLDSGAEPFTIDDFRKRKLLNRDGPKISIIIPFHDDVDTIETAIRSIAGQSWTNLEILAVKDGSNDGSADVVRRLAEADPRISLLSNSRSPGVYGARNSAVQAASGAYIGFLDADDWAPAEKLARQAAHLQKSALSLGNHIRMDESGAPLAPRIFPLVRPVPITMLVRREAWEAAGPFEEVKTGADSEMLARLEMLHGKSAVARDPAVLLVARWRKGSLSEAKEGGLFGAERYAYRAQWMFRHAGLEAPGEA